MEFLHLRFWIFKKFKIWDAKSSIFNFLLNFKIPYLCEFLSYDNEKEFDFYREKKEPHPIFKKYKLNFIPYQHKDIDQWRESLKGGISYHDEGTNLILHGGVDDIWYDLDEKKLDTVEKKNQWIVIMNFITKLLNFIKLWTWNQEKTFTVQTVTIQKLCC